MSNIDGYPKALDEEKMNSHYTSINKANGKSSEAHGEPVKDQPHTVPSGLQGSYNSPMHGKLMNWTKILESLDNAIDGINQINSDPMNDTIEGTAPTQSTAGSEDEKKEILAELNKIFTPILVMQGFEGMQEDQIKEAFEQAEVLTERNIIKFDDQTRMSQLIAACALLINQKRNTPDYQTYQKAAIIRNSTKVKMIEDTYDEALAMAKDFLLMVSTTNNSPVARDAATELLPETQH